MLTPGDVLELDLGTPKGSEAGLQRPVVVVTAARVLQGGPKVVPVVPLTRSVRDSRAEVVIEADVANGLDRRSSAQCQHVRSIATTRIRYCMGNVGSVVVRELRETLAAPLDLE